MPNDPPPRGKVSPVSRLNSPVSPVTLAALACSAAIAIVGARLTSAMNPKHLSFIHSPPAVGQSCIDCEGNLHDLLDCSETTPKCPCLRPVRSLSASPQRYDLTETRTSGPLFPFKACATIPEMKNLYLNSQKEDSKPMPTSG